MIYEKGKLLCVSGEKGGARKEAGSADRKW
jgi:hypothetical protein